MRKIVLIIAVVTLTIFGFMFYQYHEQKKEVGQFEIYQEVLNDKSAKIYEQATDWSKPISIDTHDARLEPEFQTMADFMLKMMLQNAELRNTYLRELKEVGWDQFLNIQRLDKDRQQNYLDTETMLEQVQMTMDLYQQNLDEHKKEIKGQIHDLPIKARFRRYLNEALVKNNVIDDNQALFELEKARFNRAKQLFELLKNNTWISKNNMFMFHDQKVVTAFNHLYKEIAIQDKQMNQISKSNRKALEQAL